MPGPLANVDTIVGGVNLDINRLLYYGSDVVLRFIVPDENQLDGFRTLLVLSEGFDRISKKDNSTRSGGPVIFRVADLDGQVAFIIREKDLCIEVQDEVFTVGSVPRLSPNVGQIYELTCIERKTRVRLFS